MGIEERCDETRRRLCFVCSMA